MSWYPTVVEQAASEEDWVRVVAGPYWGTVRAPGPVSNARNLLRSACLVENLGPAGDVMPGGKIHIEAPGSGGYGRPQERDRDRLRNDVLDGYVTVEAAQRDYGANLDELIPDAE